MGLLKFLVIITFTALFESGLFTLRPISHWRGSWLFFILGSCMQCACLHFSSFQLILLVKHIEYFSFLASVIIERILLDDFSYLKNVLSFASTLLARAAPLLFHESILRRRCMLIFILIIVSCQLDTGVAGRRWEIVCHSLRDLFVLVLLFNKYIYTSSIKLRLVISYIFNLAYVKIKTNRDISEIIIYSY